MSDGKQRVIDYYRDFDEWRRLETPSGRLELRRCLELVDRHLPTPAAILDLGGGPGRYTIALARRGHEVTLVDLSPDNAATAREQIVAHGLTDRLDPQRDVHVGDACDLSRFDDETFDATIAFGPFYHLTRREDLARAASEVARVTRLGGTVFAQFLPPLSDYIRILDRAASHPTHVTVETVRTAREDGVFHNAADAGFQEGVHLEADAARSLFESVGIRTVDVLSVRGIAAWHEAALAEVETRDEALHAELLDLIDATCRRPEVIEMGAVALFVGRNE